MTIIVKKKNIFLKSEMLLHNQLTNQKTYKQTDGNYSKGQWIGVTTDLCNTQSY